MIHCQRFQRGELFLLRYLFRYDAPAQPAHLIRAWVGFRSDHSVEPPVDKLDRAVIFERDSAPADAVHHPAELSPPRDAARHAVVVRAMYAWDEAQTLDINVFPIPRMIDMESEWPESNQQIAPALMPARTIPDSQAFVSTLSTPERRQVRIMKSVLPPPT